jgi:hypothetical protein
MNPEAPGNLEGFITPESTTQTPNKQGVTITTANIGDYAGNVDVTPLQGRQKDWKQAFDWQPGGRLAPLSKLISHKNELEDSKFKAGLKKAPRQNAADWILKAMAGEPGAKNAPRSMSVPTLMASSPFRTATPPPRPSCSPAGRLCRSMS